MDTTAPQPKAIFWYRFYCCVMVLLYLAVLALGVVFLVVSPETLEMQPTEAKLMGGLFAASGLALGIVFLAGLFIPQKPWAWVYSLILICVGLTSIPFWVFSIPLLIQWLKPGVKDFYGRL